MKNEDRTLTADNEAEFETDFEKTLDKLARLESERKNIIAVKQHL